MRLPNSPAPGIDLRLLQRDDAEELARAYVRNRDHLAPWEPARSDEFFTEAWQQEDIGQRIAAGEAGTAFSFGLFSAGEVVGRFNLAGVVHGPFESAGLGYWVDQRWEGRGLATATVRALLDWARAELGLHRVEASTLVHNLGSQRVLAKAGFEQIGYAPKYLNIAGSWQDHHLYQVLLH
ncbi:GNAT family N-acetyltransferase [Leucobacter musarum]|uniref:GNAT family N-acetyltransferase n=1 Tax=Leucobacter musarum TaxID=1930747 RepID=UPI0006A763AC|nr:GNAT family N-acetyltransferase [Leucobacter musarum]